MPIYRWEDKNTGKKVEIIRSMRESDDTPTRREANMQGMSEEEHKNAKWEKVITGGAGHVGFGQKGYWFKETGGE